MSASVLRSPSSGDVLSPPAIRARRPSWRDPRLAIGLVLVCVSVLAGARVLASSDDTVAVMAARSELVTGQVIDAGDVTEVRLRFASADDADRYLSAAQELPQGAVLLRPVGSGELVPRAALTTEEDGLVELPLAVDPGRVPASVRTGSVVDVWVASGDEGGGPTEQLLTDVPVLAVSRAGGLTSGGMRQVVVGVPGDDRQALRDVVGRLDGALLLVRQQG